MTGLLKPLSQRGRHDLSRRPRNPAVRADAGGGDKRDDGFFVSSYRDHKYQKRSKKERRKTWLLAVLTAIVLAVALTLAKIRPRSSTSPQPNTETSTKSLDPEGKPNTETSTKSSDPGPEVRPDSGAKPLHIAKGSPNFICGRRLPLNLESPMQWPTEHTTLKRTRVTGGDKEVVLLKKGHHSGELGSRLDSFFHAYDFAYDKNLPLYITQDSWVFDTLFPLFLGPAAAVEKNSKLWSTAQELLNVRVMENEGVLRLMGISVVDDKSPEELVTYSSDKLDPETIRNHRNTILRKLFRYPSNSGVVTENVCSAFKHGTIKDEKYVAIHIAGWNKNDDMSTKDLDYAKSVLQQLDMLDRRVYLVDDMRGDAQDAARSSGLKAAGLPKQFRHVGSRVYLAVLADAYLGDPVDRTGLWIARMRCALGMGNTFLFARPEGGGGGWASPLDNGGCPDLYDSGP